MFKLAGELVPVTEEHIVQVLANARAEDRQEFECIDGRSLEEELRHSIDISCGAWAYVVDCHVLAVFGEVPLDDGVGVPWLISTNAICKHRRSFLMHCDQQIASMRQRYKLLINYTDARYSKALAWMKWMGFTMHQAVPYGINQEPFHPFTLRGF